MNFAGPATRQHVEDFETTKTQYSTDFQNVVSTLPSLMHHRVKDYHRQLIYISHLLTQTSPFLHFS